MSKNNQGGFGWSQGVVTGQPHVDIPSGTYEEEHGRRGFFGRVSHLYHRHPPTGWLRVEGPASLRSLRVCEIAGKPNSQPADFLVNQDVRVGMAGPTQGMNVFFRNADEDEVRFIHRGSGVLETEYGSLSYSKGDYIVIPRGTTYRWNSKAADEKHLVVSSKGEIELPDRGMLGRHAQFDPMVMRTPALDSGISISGKNSRGEYELWVKRSDEITKVFYPFSPLDIAGWKGDLCPWAINVSEIRPIISPRYHLPPSVHTTFVAQNFVICSFLPRPLESEKGAMKVPFYHRNIDFDEVLFYHSGNFFSREGIKEGWVTFHPQGLHHGPHPNAEKNAADKENTEEIAVMIDTRNPLQLTEVAQSVDNPDYVMSWKADQLR